MRPATLNPNTPDDPGCNAWRDLDEADLTAEEEQRRERHLESCPTCQRHIDQLVAAEAEFLRRGRQLGDPTAAPADPTLVQALGKLLDESKFAAPAPDLYFLKPSDRPDLLGTLHGYEVEEVIGHGGMGIVLRAYEPALQRRVAIKVLAPALAGSATARNRFMREARAAAAVRHDNNVSVYSVAENEGLPYIVMEYIAGESLQDRLDRAGPLPVSEVIQLGLQAAAALAAAHEQGLIHRDIKPANILLEQGTGRVKITDFGLARVADDTSTTQAGVVAGTPEFMAPEQARAERLDARSDLFSLGSVLYAACTGTAPFGGSTTLGVLRQVSEQTPTAIRALNREIPRWLETLINRLMAKKPGDRIQTATQVIELLQTGAKASMLPSGWQARRGLLVVLAVVLGLTPILLALFAQVSGPTAGTTPAEFYHDFCGQPLPASIIQFGEPESIRFEPEGLRLLLPQDRFDLGPVGVATNFELTGDFEITTTFELLEMETPPPSYGVGVTLGIRKALLGSGSAAIGRVVRDKGRQLVMWEQSFEEGDGKLQSETGSFPITEMIGRLRLQRTGGSLRFAWAPGTTGDSFRDMYRCEFGRDAIGRVTVSGVTGRKPCKLDARILDLRIRVADAADLPAASAQTPHSGSLRGWLLLGGISALVTLLGVAAWHARRRDKRAAPGTNATGVASEVISLSCSGCGKTFRARARVAGKKVKCPGCGQVIVAGAPEA